MTPPPPQKKKKKKKNIHKILILKNIHFLKTPKYIKIQNFEPPKITRAYVCMKIQMYQSNPPGATVCQYHYLFNQSCHQKEKLREKSKQSSDLRARLSPVPSPVSCPVVSDDFQFKLQIRNLKSLDIIHDALH